VVEEQGKQVSPLSTNDFAVGFRSILLDGLCSMDGSGEDRRLSVTGGVVSVTATVVSVTGKALSSVTDKRLSVAAFAMAIMSIVQFLMPVGL
jgi:hypothetical protein